CGSITESTSFHLIQLPPPLSYSLPPHSLLPLITMVSGSTVRQSDPTLEAVNMATLQMEKIVDALLGHAKDVGGALRNKKITVQKNEKTGGKFVHRVEELSEQPKNDHHQPSLRESAGRDDEPTVLSVRCVANTNSENGPQFARSKKRIDLPQQNRKLVLDSAVNKNDGPMPFEVSVKKTKDPNWYYLSATVLQKNGEVLFVVETEAKGDRLRNTRINGKPAVPDNQ
ncbi:hypothetical protein PMAYCL1PPCAC_29837, partial [Pristionchus mayeri]